jgi:protein involved in polysaccharide export with SLBB domain
MKLKYILFAGLLFSSGLFSQNFNPDTEALIKKEQPKSKVKPIDFSKYFENEKLTQEEHERILKEREAKLKEQLITPVAFENSIDPEEYIIGPGDVFFFNIWSSAETSLLVSVNPEGSLSIPSVGEIPVAGETLVAAREKIIRAAQQVYENSKISLSLEMLRFFKIFVTGEVKFPGTYISQGCNRVSDAIMEAGGLTSLASKMDIQVRHSDGNTTSVDLSKLESEGNITRNNFLNGGDIIYVPSITMNPEKVFVEGDIDCSGIHGIAHQEPLLFFLERIRAVDNNTPIERIGIITAENSEEIVYPFTKSPDINFHINNNDRIIVPSKFVYVQGSVLAPGAFLYSRNLLSKDYAGMAGADYRSGGIRSVAVLHVRKNKIEKGLDVIVEPGDIVTVSMNWSEKYYRWIQMVPLFTSLILAAKAAGFF